MVDNMKGTNVALPRRRSSKENETGYVISQKKKGRGGKREIEGGGQKRKRVLAMIERVPRQRRRDSLDRRGKRREEMEL